jgi:hypothetical protein
MGQANKRGSKEERIMQALAAKEAELIESREQRRIANIEREYLATLAASAREKRIRRENAAAKANNDVLNKSTRKGTIGHIGAFGRGTSIASIAASVAIGMSAYKKEEK